MSTHPRPSNPPGVQQHVDVLRLYGRGVWLTTAVVSVIAVSTIMSKEDDYEETVRELLDLAADEAAWPATPSWSEGSFWTEMWTNAWPRVNTQIDNIVIRPGGRRLSASDFEDLEHLRENARVTLYRITPHVRIDSDLDDSTLTTIRASLKQVTANIAYPVTSEIVELGSWAKRTSSGVMSEIIEVRLAKSNPAIARDDPPDATRSAAVHSVLIWDIRLEPDDEAEHDDATRRSEERLETQSLDTDTYAIELSLEESFRSRFPMIDRFWTLVGSSGLDGAVETIRQELASEKETYSIFGLSFSHKLGSFVPCVLIPLLFLFRLHLRRMRALLVTPKHQHIVRRAAWLLVMPGSGCAFGAIGSLAVLPSAATLALSSELLDGGRPLVAYAVVLSVAVVVLSLIVAVEIRRVRERLYPWGRVVKSSSKA